MYVRMDDLVGRTMADVGKDSTLIVMAGEFGRTPKLSSLNKYYNGAGRDHWGAVQSVFFAGGGIRGGTVIGSSDTIGAPARRRPV